MSDLIKRLRDSGDDPLENYKMCDEAADRIEALENALREAERFVSYLANETDGRFDGPGTPSRCLVKMRAALAPEKDT